MQVEELRKYVKDYLWSTDTTKPYTGNGRSGMDELVILQSGKKATEIPCGHLINLILRKMSENPFSTICDNLGKLIGLDYKGTATVPMVDGKQTVDKVAAQTLIDQISDFNTLIHGILGSFLADLNHVKQELIFRLIHPNDPNAISEALSRKKPLVLDDTLASK